MLFLEKKVEKLRVISNVGREMFETLNFSQKKPKENKKFKKNNFKKMKSRREKYESDFQDIPAARRRGIESW